MGGEGSVWTWQGERGERPWGHYIVLVEADGYKVKRFTVLPGRRLSLQRHRHRAEHWYVVRGRARVTREEETLDLAGGDSVDIPVGAVHRVENVGPGELVVVEVQTGGYVGEDDIERLQDDYERA